MYEYCEQEGYLLFDFSSLLLCILVTLLKDLLLALLFFLLAKIDLICHNHLLTINDILPILVFFIIILLVRHGNVLTERLDATKGYLFNSESYLVT